MAKINIYFNNTDFQIDESALAPATANLESHLSTVMSGTGATISLGGTTYNVDADKLDAATNNFASHLGTIAGDGAKVVVGGVEYGIDSTKIAGAISSIETALSSTGEERLEGDGAEYYTLAPTALSFRSTAPLNELQEVQINGVTVDPSNYTLEEGSTIVTFPIEYLKTLDKGDYEVDVVSDSKSVKGGFTVAAPELNEYGFYYNQPYTAWVDYFSAHVVMFIREDGTMDNVVVEAGATETCTYTISGGVMTMNSPSMGELHGTFSADGMSLYNPELDTSLTLCYNKIFAADNDYIYIYKEDLGGYEVTTIDKTKAEYGAIKTGINGIDTVKLADDIFRQCFDLVSITIPNSATGIGSRAFRSCSSLTSVIIPDGVTEIGSEAFLDCSSLTSITIPDSVTTIEPNTFQGCSSLTSIVIPNSVTRIAYGAFLGCDNLASVTIGREVTRIEYDAFYICDSLTSITIPNSVTHIGERAFAGCSSLTNILFTGTTEQWHAIGKDYDVYGIDNWNRDVPATYVQCSDGQVII